MLPDTARGGITTEVEQLLSLAYTLRVSDLKEAKSLAKKALALSRQIDDHQLIGRSLNTLSLFYMIMGDNDKSIAAANEAIICFEQLDDDRGIADAKYNLAGVHYKTDNYHLGLVYLIDSLTTYRKYNDHYNQARAQKALGTIYEYIGDARNAEQAYHACIDEAKKIDDLNLVSNAYNPLSGIYLKQGKIQKAQGLIEEAIKIKTRTGDVRGLAFSFYGRAKIAIHNKQYDIAERDLTAALEIHQRENERLGTAMALYRQALLYYDMGDLERSREVLESALAFSEQFNITIIKFKSNFLLYLIYKAENNTQRSLEYLELYLKQKEAVINTQTLKVIENYELITKMQALEAEAKSDREKAEILEKKELAEKAAKMKQDFLSAMSHEIRTPLNAVISITNLLSERQEPGEKELFDSLKFASNNLLNIINDILDFNKLDAGKVELEKRPCEIRALLNHLVRTYEQLAVNKGLSVKLKVDDAVHESYDLDETRLSQILGNLISNAIKYTEIGGVNITIEMVTKTGDDDILRFTVQDTGTGIPVDHFDKLFDSFSQPKTVTTRKEGGSGLGLAIVKRLVELYDSEIIFNSEVDKGSLFLFDLQLKRSAPAAIPTTPNTETMITRSVLLAEDNMINALVARRLLGKWGIVADHAKNGLEAVAMAGEKQYDIILMDIHMPEMNGFDATKTIRSTVNHNSKTPIFALTADITASDQAEYFAYFNGFLSKPIEVDKLQKAIMSDLFQ